MTANAPDTLRTAPAFFEAQARPILAYDVPPKHVRRVSTTPLQLGSYRRSLRFSASFRTIRSAPLKMSGAEGSPSDAVAASEPGPIEAVLVR